MSSQQSGGRASTRFILWAVEIAVLVVLLLLVGFLESLPGLRPIFTPQGAFFIRLFVVVAWALTSFYFNESRTRAR